MAAEGVCTHMLPPLSPPRDGEGDLDVLVRSGVLKSRGWWRVETMIVVLRFHLVLSQSMILEMSRSGGEIVNMLCGS